MLRFLTDEQISPKIAEQVSKRRPKCPIFSLYEWKGGAYIGSPDRSFIPEAIKDGLTVVTYDRRTITPLLQLWAKNGWDHSGFVFVDEKTIASNNFGLLVKSLTALWEKEGRHQWKNRVLFLDAE